MPDHTLLADCFTEAEAAEQLHTSRRTIARYRNEPDGLPYFMLGGRVYIRRKDWEAWLERRIIKPNPTRSEPRVW